MYNICNHCLKILHECYTFQKRCWNSFNSLKQKHEQIVIENKTKQCGTIREATNSLNDSKIIEKYKKIDEVEEIANDFIEVNKSILESQMDDELFVTESSNTIMETKSIETIKKLSKKCTPQSKNLKPKSKRTRRSKKTYESTICDICGQIYSSSFALKIHIRHSHENVRDFPCTICSFRSHRKKGLELHMHTHTGERPYKCDLCDNTYQTSSARANHRRSHFDERPYTCEICSKSFKKKDIYRGHLKIHDPAARKQCRYCDKSFVKNEHLKHHEMIHTNDRPHKCIYCSKGFIQKLYLKSHMKTCNGNT